MRAICNATVNLATDGVSKTAGSRASVGQRKRQRALHLTCISSTGASWTMLSQFPLTPALSPREREDRRQSAGEAYVLAILQGRVMLHPLLGERAGVRGN